jgi:uncharacterized membrane protein
VLGIIYCANSYQINFIGAGIMIFFAVCNIILMASTIFMAYESSLKKIWRRSNG